MKLTRFVLFCTLLSLQYFSVYAGSLQQRIDEIIQEELPNATIGILIQEVESNKVIYARHAKKLLYPASNMKLFTAVAALYQFKPDYQYETALFQKGNHFYLTFSGSPAFKTSDLKALLIPLIKRDPKIISGNIYLDTSRVLPPYYAAGVSYDDLGWYYNAPSTAIILDGNAAQYDFISATKIGGPVQIKPKNGNTPLKLVNELKTVDYKQVKTHCELNIEIKAHNTLRLYGCMAQQKEPRRMQLAIPNPDLLATQVIEETLQEHQIQLQGKILYGTKPKRAKKLSSHHSEDLTQLVKYMLEESDNLYADSLTKLLGYELTQQGNYIQGRYAIQHILKKQVELNQKQLKLADGHGSRYNLASPEQITTLLLSAYRDPKIKSVFLDTLPRMGISGTLKHRMKHTILENRVWAKTGTMHDITSLSGYLIQSNGKPLAFSIIVNGINGNLGQAKRFQDKVLLSVASGLSEQSFGKKARH